MSTEHKVLIAFAVIVITLFILAFYGWYTGAWENFNAT